MLNSPQPHRNTCACHRGNSKLCKSQASVPGLHFPLFKMGARALLPVATFSLLPWRSSGLYFLLHFFPSKMGIRVLFPVTVLSLLTWRSSGFGTATTAWSTSAGASAIVASRRQRPNAAATQGDTALPICWYLHTRKHRHTVNRAGQTRLIGTNCGRGVDLWNFVSD